jgi:adenylate cyclase
LTPKKILVVDDEEAIVRLCCKVLEKEGYRATGVTGGKDAAQRASKEKYHMTVTDMSMPGMNGLETFLALREVQPEIIGIMITGNGTIDTAVQAMRLGFSSFVRKPFNSGELVQVVKDAFTKAALAEENSRLKTLMSLYELGERFISSGSREEIIESLIEIIASQTGAQRISVMLHDREENCLKIVASKGIPSGVSSKVRIGPGEKIAGLVFQEGRPLVLNRGFEKTSEFKSLPASRDMMAAMCLPLKAKNKTLGVLNISKPENATPFSEAEMEMASLICRQAVMAMENLEAMAEKAEKARMRSLLEQYVAPEVAETLLLRGKDMLDVGEIQRITVLFADIRGFTPLVQQLPLETIRSFLNDVFGLFSEVIFKFKGTLDKFMGDAVLAFFGAPISLDGPEAAAAGAACLMQRAFEDLRDAWAEEENALVRVGLGIGISAGEVFLGNVGSRRRFDYTAIGVPVNIAQRLASDADSGEILVTHSVADRLGLEFSVVNESSRLLKGLERPIGVLSLRKNTCHEIQDKCL